MADNEPSENDEIPPDTDIEKQYKENEQSTSILNKLWGKSPIWFSPKK